MAKKGYVYPIKRKIPLILLLNLFGIFIITHFSRFVNAFMKKINCFPRKKIKVTTLLSR